MQVVLSVPEAYVGDVIGDLNSRRGRPQGMEPVGRDDRDQGRGADGRDAHLRPRPALDHAGSGRLHARVPALRGGARTPRAEGRRAGRRAARRQSTPKLPRRHRRRCPDSLVADGHAHDRHLPAGCRVRCVRAAAAARRAAGRLPGRTGGGGSCASCARRVPRTRAGCARQTANRWTCRRCARGGGAACSSVCARSPSQRARLPALPVSSTQPTG